MLKTEHNLLLTVLLLLKPSMQLQAVSLLLATVDKTNRGYHDTITICDYG